jgi:hypothetical protein
MRYMDPPPAIYDIGEALLLFVERDPRFRLSARTYTAVRDGS